MVLSLSLCGAGSAGAEQAAPGQKREPEMSKPDQYRQQAVRRMKFNACVKIGKVQCYRKYQDAVEWCDKNWQQCYPLIEGIGVHAANYGEQVFRKCRSELEDRCRKEVEP